MKNKRKYAPEQKYYAVMDVDKYIAGARKTKSEARYRLS